ncbi:MAG: DUF4124 domain-containing protein [Pseudomonadota bacterium]
MTELSPQAPSSGKILTMKRVPLPMMLLAAMAAAPVVYADKPMYRWVDENGVVHVGDSIPARYADQHKEILNDQGVAIGEIRGRATAEELAQEAAEQEAKAALERARRADQALLATYLSIGEIERHRDRRVELLVAQGRVSELYLTNLRKRLVTLLDEASAFKPYTVDPDAPMIRPALADDIKQTKDAIIRYEARLANNRREAESLREEFTVAINRYAELTQASN